MAMFVSAPSIDQAVDALKQLLGPRANDSGGRGFEWATHLEDRERCARSTARSIPTTG